MNYNFLSTTVLFQGMSEEDIQFILKCLSTEEKSFPKGSAVYHAGEIVHSLGIVLSGAVYVENDDIWGNKSILDYVEPGEVFAETYACIPEEPLMVNVVAAEICEILFINTRRLLSPCSENCSYHSRLLRNLLTISAQKNLNLSNRIFLTSSKSIRGRLLSYLSFQATRLGVYEFNIPFNRQQLADYLNVDRSALSSELSKMQKEGILTYHKNHFHLYKKEHTL